MTPLMCLAVSIFFEAGIEPVEGKEAVASVILNRVEDHRYPDDICSVVFEHRQFSFTHDGKSDKLPTGKLAEESMTVAKEALQGNIAVSTSTHYHTDYVSPEWAKVFTFDGKVGRHLFYTNETPYR